MANQDNLKKTVNVLSHVIGPRSFLHLDALGKSVRYITEILESYGYEVSNQSFEFESNLYLNVIAERRGTTHPEKIVIVGAHYDTVAGSPGADDNASGIAGLLELARLLREGEHGKTIRFAAFTLEEPPAFRSSRMGSYVYARSIRERGDEIEGMICIEMIGYFTDEPNSQYYPAGFFSWLYPDKGNYISLVSDLHSKGFLKKVKEGFRKGTDLPVESIATLSIVPGIDFSDHRSFWKFGYRALMVTDTAFYRNPNYHRMSDTPDTLDYVRMAEVVEGLKAAIETVAKG
jgi:Zn-dependent M28 family amino/carboxypeptidase